MNWSPLAINRLSEAAKYIALDNPVAAERWLSKVFDQVEKLSEFPERGRMVPEVAKYFPTAKAVNRALKSLISEGKVNLPRKDLHKPD